MKESSNSVSEPAAYVNQIFGLLDEYIDECVLDETPWEKLYSFYWQWWDYLKEKHAGTASGFTGLSEYLVFRYILKRIEYITKTKFEARAYTTDIWKFESKDFLLTHGIDISKELVKGISSPQCTDIALLASSGNGTYRLLAAFEVKVHISDKGIFKKLVERLENLHDHTEALVFSVFFHRGNRQHAKEMADFCNRCPDRAFLIADHRVYPHGIDIRKAIDMIPL